MTLRLAKIVLVAAIALFYTLVVLNNTTDYYTNYQWVHHVLMMDTTFPGNHGMWRAIHHPVIHTLFYGGIISWEGLTMILAWLGVVQLARALRRPAAEFHAAKRIATIALTLGLMLWFVAFITIGGEWFLMWQSKLWNGQEAAFRMFTVIGIIFVLLILPETEHQP